MSPAVAFDRTRCSSNTYLRAMKVGYAIKQAVINGLRAFLRAPARKGD
jgi:hypothetical protein